MMDVRIKRPETDLTGKCGSCYYAKYEPNKTGKIDSLVRCTNPKHLVEYCKRKDVSLRERTIKACKLYKSKEEGNSK